MQTASKSTRVRVRALSLAALAMSAVACSSEGSSVESGAESPSASSVHVGDAAPEGLFSKESGPSWVTSAGVGDDLALVRQEPGTDDIWRATAAYTRDAAGVWSELPVPKVSGSYALASAGDTVVLGGAECVDEPCEQYRPRFLVLSEDRTSWLDTEADLPPLVGTSTEGFTVRGSRTAMDHAVLTIDSTTYAVDATGKVGVLTTPAPIPGHDQLSCSSGDVQIVVSAVPTPDRGVLDYEARLVGEVAVQHLDRLDEPLAPVATVPEVVVNMDSVICGWRQLTAHAGSTSYTFDADANQWTEAESNFLEVNGSLLSTVVGGQIALSDGTVFDDNLRRAPDGTWSSIPNGLFLVATRGTTVYALTDDGVITFQHGKN